MRKIMCVIGLGGLACLASAETATAGYRWLGGNQTIVTCQLSCVKSLDGKATNYRICTNNLTGQIVSIAQAPTQRGCHTFP